MIRIPTTATLVVAACLFSGVPARASDASGFLYGTVITESGTEYRGVMRWGKQEAFWDDLFHSLKEELPYRDVVKELGLIDAEDEDRQSRVRVFNLKFEWSGSDGSASRVFIARFGDIEKIEVTGRESALVVLRNGESHEVSGYSDDVGGTIRMNDATLGEIDLEWDRIESIRFEAAPSSTDPGVERLYGVLETDSGRFEGYVMWDKEECTTTDLLDGDSEDGKLSIEMGRIESIERRGRRASIVRLQDGRELRLRGSNDVNQDNRGIMIEDARFGKVTVPWDAFDRLELREAPGSGPGYDTYPEPRELRGRVTDHEGNVVRGRIVFDLDEASTWEILNGQMRDIEFDVPFARIASIRPSGSDASVVTLLDGEELELEDSQDVSESNDGVLIYTADDEDPTYLAWRDVELIEFER